eukprot:TRINITY_DN1604_c0_g1_i6.p1 TRINITY_DN1604_c0_g1~~TRINITY_DN1604_c0_g1_i6.p1  ORF type:complete len:896 (+),score=213.48 TRINITY_DN1604_c0_g1_i6:1541-4228(+)
MECLWTLEAPNKNVEVCCLVDATNLHNSPCVWSTYNDGTVCLWHPESYHCLTELRGESMIKCMAVRNFCVWGGDESKVFIWYFSQPGGSVVINGENGERYVGGTKEVGGKNFKHGQGEFHWRQGQQEIMMYAGKWKNDKRHGFGVQVHHREGKYYGNWREDEKSGYGVQIFPDGVTHVVQWAHGKQKGQGCIIFPNGDEVAGVFDGNAITSGTFTKRSSPSLSYLRRRYSSGSAAKNAGGFGGGQGSFDGLPPPVTEKAQFTQKWVTFVPHTLDEKGGKHSKALEKLLIPGGKGDKGGKKINYRVMSILLNDNKHKLGKCMRMFTHMFSVMYGAATNPQLALIDATDDIHSFADQLLTTIENTHGPQTPRTRSELLYLIKSIIISFVFQNLYALFRMSYKAQSRELQINLNSLRLKTMKELGLSEKLWLGGETAEAGPVSACGFDICATAAPTLAASPSAAARCAHDTARPESPVFPLRAAHAYPTSPADTASPLSTSSSASSPSPPMTPATGPEPAPAPAGSPEDVTDPLGALNVTPVNLSPWIVSSPATRRTSSLNLNDETARLFVRPQRGSIAAAAASVQRTGAKGKWRSLRLYQSADTSSSDEQSQPSDTPHLPSEDEAPATTAGVATPQQQQQKQKLPYNRAIKQLRRLTGCTSVQSILECILGLNGAILTDINEYYRTVAPKSNVQIDLGCDHMVSILTHVLIKANVPDLPAKLAFVNEFADKQLMSEEASFRVLQLEEAMKYNQGLRWEVKDENGVSIPIQVVEKKLLETLRVQRRVLQQRHGGVACSHLLCELLLLCGTLPFSIQVIGEKLVRPPLRIPYEDEDFNWIPNLRNDLDFEFASSVLSSIGIVVERGDADVFVLKFTVTYSPQVYIQLSKLVESDAVSVT